MKTPLTNLKLRTELRSAGAKPAELPELLTIAKSLKQLQPINAKRGLLRTFAPLATATITGLVIGSFLVTVAQSSLPGTALYPVKTLSEHVAVAVDPNYQSTRMMRRAQEVQELVAKGASSHTVLATLADYQNEAAAYRSTGKDYSVFEYCKANLQQAAKDANTTERKSIESTLQSLQTV